MFSLREFLWLKLYGGAFPPVQRSGNEILVALGAALVVILSWLLVRRLFFLVAQWARPARITAFIFCLSWAIAWLIGALDPFEYRSFSIMLLLSILSLCSCLGYLFWLRGR